MLQFSSSICELIVDQLVGFPVVEPAHPGSSHRLGTGARIFLDLFIFGVSGAMLLVKGDVPSHRGRIYVRVLCVHRGECACVLWASLL